MANIQNHDDFEEHIERHFENGTELSPRSEYSSSGDATSHTTNSFLTKSIMHKLFGPMEDDSIRGSMFIMANLSLAVSSLALPLTLGTLSIFFGIVAITMISYFTYISLSIVIRTANRYNTYDLSMLVKIHLGYTFHKIFDILNSIYLFGILASYQVITAKILGLIIFDIAFTKSLYPNDTIDHYMSIGLWSELWVRILSNYGIAVILFFPISLIRDLNRIVWASVLGMFAFMYMLAV